MVTSAKDWRKAREEGIELTFDSGFTAMIRPIEVDYFIREKTIPNVLMPIVTKLIGDTTAVTTLPTEEQLAEHKEWVAFLNELAIYAFVAPKVKGAGEALQDDEISVDDISYGDKLVLYRLFSRPAQFLRGFRAKQVELMAVVGERKGNSPAPKRDAAPERVGVSDNGNARSVDGMAIR